MTAPLNMALKGELDRIFLPVRADLDALEKRLISILKTDEPQLAKALSHIEAMRGKLIRPALIFLTAKTYGGVTARHGLLAHAVELTHIASLLHDDVVDHSELRRGRASLNALLGDEQAILVGDYLFARALEMLEGVGDTEAFVMVARFIGQASSGELHQLSRAFMSDVTEEEYYSYIRRKTAGLFALATSLSAKLSGVSGDERELNRSFGESFGMAFQVADDCSDLLGDSGDEGKPVMKDISEGQMTLPAILLFRKLGQEWGSRILRGVRDGDPDAFKEISDAIRDREIILACASKVNGFVKSAMEAAVQIEGGSGGPLVRLAQVLMKKLNKLAEGI
ncbi:MAG: polyprenyl synthetase family protein [Planctomycetota bacterium]